MESSEQAEILQAWLVKCNVQHQSVYLECEENRRNCINENTKRMEKMEGKAVCEKGQRNFTIKVEKTWDLEERKSEEMSQ